MGIIIQTDIQRIERSPLPPTTTGSGMVPIMITLECDAASAFFCRGVAVFRSLEGYVGAHAAAMNAGWLERQAPQGRLWLCPECSGKSS